ncbi:PREDICTED: ankyrin repeat and SOCS box protein 14-like isoform X2 [Ceratosolen solmsi marchali]|uniref:Ankyrin repeat and SOCS box protein 14-like isoform X2 n=1 Tax=Ceratosolen solmsi marchali TaxID=326594 RepID=A0AAJ6YH59_9HYME|nr:PREDICTED: ankyrin repeat and SOCS box protein 14-like isoform X2 [Ceratosolen solmsi marchali]
MVLAGSGAKADYPTSSARKVKIKQRVAETSTMGGARSTIPFGSYPSTGRPSVARGTHATKVTDSGTRISPTSGAARLPLHPKLRKVLVEGQQGKRDSPVASRSRNSAEAGLRGQQPSAARRKSARGTDVLTAAVTSSRRARSSSPVLSRPRGPGLSKSISAPAELELEAPLAGILKRSSTFLAGLALLRRRSRASSPRKCVSFSADTSFAGTIERTAVHEARLYRRGVLEAIASSADRHGREDEPSAELPSPRLDAPGGPRALLGAAHEGDDELARRILAQARKPVQGEPNIEVDAVDASGRTAISYMAGNGSALVLETCLTFHGADANLPDNEGNTPLHFAAQAGQTECLNILLQRCPTIEVDARNSLGFTPLMKAALQGRTKCAKILLFAGANPTLRDHGRGLRAEQWARYCGRYVCAEVIERFARHRLLEKSTSCRWGSEPELAAQVLQGKLMPITSMPMQPPSRGLRSKIRRVFRTSSNSDKSFSLVSQLTSAALCASSPVLPKPSDVSPAVKSLLRPLSVPQLRITLVAPQDMVEKTNEKCCSHSATFLEKIESSIIKPPRTKKKSK